jgi:hypothetical protein
MKAVVTWLPKVALQAPDTWGSVAVTMPSTKAASSTKAQACTLSGKGHRSQIPTLGRDTRGGCTPVN